MRLTIAYSKIKKRNLVLINNDTYQRETLSERPIRQPLRNYAKNFSKFWKSYLTRLSQELSGVKGICFRGGKVNFPEFFPV